MYYIKQSTSLLVQSFIWDFNPYSAILIKQFFLGKVTPWNYDISISDLFRTHECDYLKIVQSIKRPIYWSMVNDRQIYPHWISKVSSLSAINHEVTISRERYPYISSESHILIYMIPMGFCYWQYSPDKMVWIRSTSGWRVCTRGLHFLLTDDIYKFGTMNRHLIKWLDRIKLFMISYITCRNAVIFHDVLIYE